MSVLGWLVVGLLEGFIAGRLAQDEGGALLVDLVLGAAGALAGGLMFISFGTASVGGLNFFSLLVALVGAVVVLVIHHALTRRGVF